MTFLRRPLIQSLVSSPGGDLNSRDWLHKRHASSRSRWRARSRWWALPAHVPALLYCIGCSILLPGPRQAKAMTPAWNLAVWLWLWSAVRVLAFVAVCPGTNSTLVSEQRTAGGYSPTMCVLCGIGPAGHDRAAPSCVNRAECLRHTSVLWRLMQLRWYY